MLVAKHEHSTQLEAQLAKARAEAEEWKGLSDELEGMTAETTALRNEVQGQKQATQGLQQTVGRLRGERERALLQSQQREQQHDLERAERLKMYRDSEMEILVREGALQREVDRLRGQAGAAETDFTQQTALRNEVQELDQANQGLKQTATRLRGERDCILLQFQQHNQKQVEILAREEALHREVASLKQARRQDAEARQQSVALRQALKQKVKHLEDAGCCAICLEAPPAAGFLHGDTVHRVCRGCAPKFHVGGPCPMCRVPVERVLQGGELPVHVGITSLRRSHVLSISVAAATRLVAYGGGGGDTDAAAAVAAAVEMMADAAKDGISLPVRLATDLVRLVHAMSKQAQPAGGGVVSASLLNAKPAVGGIGVELRVGGVLRVLFTVASDAVADTVVRWRHALRCCVDPSAAVFDVLSDREEARHQALWPAFVAAKAAGKRVQFHRARLVVDGERVAAPAC
ncbi:hypothetical protein FOA52_002169 [Chlamydomonas sp. UWO 241]|nr:hypothetical protein FOA52_002169 [Chlamydomonas sp. UWO 241]